MQEEDNVPVCVDLSTNSEKTEESSDCSKTSKDKFSKSKSAKIVYYCRFMPNCKKGTKCKFSHDKDAPRSIFDPNHPDFAKEENVKTRDRIKNHKDEIKKKIDAIPPVNIAPAACEPAAPVVEAPIHRQCHFVDDKVFDPMDLTIQLVEPLENVACKKIRSELVFNEHEYAAELRRITTTTALDEIMGDSWDQSDLIEFIDLWGSIRTVKHLRNLLRHNKITVPKVIDYLLVFQFNTEADSKRYFNVASNLGLAREVFGNVTLNVAAFNLAAGSTYTKDTIAQQRNSFRISFLNDVYCRLSNGGTIPIDDDFLRSLTNDKALTMWIGRIFSKNRSFVDANIFADTHEDTVYFFPSWNDPSNYYIHPIVDLRGANRVVSGHMQRLIYFAAPPLEEKQIVSDYTIEFCNIPDLSKLLVKDNAMIHAIMYNYRDSQSKGNIIRMCPIVAKLYTNIMYQPILLDHLKKAISECRKNSMLHMVVEYDNLSEWHENLSLYMKNLPATFQSKLLSVLDYISLHFSKITISITGLIAMITVGVTLGLKFSGSIFGSLLTAVNPILGAVAMLTFDPIAEELFREYNGLTPIILLLCEIVVGAIINPLSIPLRVLFWAAMTWFNMLEDNVGDHVPWLRLIRIGLHTIFNAFSMVPFGIVPMSVMLVMLLCYCSMKPLNKHKCRGYLNWIKKNILKLADQLPDCLVCKYLKSMLMWIFENLDKLETDLTLREAEERPILPERNQDFSQDFCVKNLTEVSLSSVQFLPKMRLSSSMLGLREQPDYNEWKDPFCLAINIAQDESLAAIIASAQILALKEVEDQGEVVSLMIYSTSLNMVDTVVGEYTDFLCCMYRALAPTSRDIALAQDVEVPSMTELTDQMMLLNELAPVIDVPTYPAEMTGHEFIEELKNKYDSAKVGLYAKALDGMGNRDHTLLQLSEGYVNSDPSVHFFPKTEVLMKTYQEDPANGVNLVGDFVEKRAIADTPKEGVIALTWFTENIKHMIQEKQEAGETMHKDTKNTRYYFMVGCGLSSVSINHMLAQLDRSKPVTILFLCAGDDVVIFRCVNGVWSFGLSLDLTKYDTAQVKSVLECEKQFLIACLPAFESMITQVFDTYINAMKYYYLKGEKITFRRVMRLSGAADTSLGNTIVNLGLCIMLTDKFTIDSLDGLYDRAVTVMKDYGFTYTGAKPGIIEKQTFLRGCFTLCDNNLTLVPSLGVIFKPALRVKDVRSFGLTSSQLASTSLGKHQAAMLVTAYLKSYFYAMRHWPVCTEILALIKMWDSVQVTMLEEVQREITEDRRYTVDWVESDLYVDWDELILRRYGNLDLVALCRLFEPLSEYGVMCDDTEILTVLKIDYGVTPTHLWY